jgi:ribosomal protein S18 acetylase RimI-like enzyme
MKFPNFPVDKCGFCSSCGKVGTMSVVVERATEVTPELISAFELLIPQLSSSNPPPTSSELQKIVSSDSSTLFVARVEGKIVGSLTLATFRIPTGVRAWIEDVVVDSSARGHGVGEALNQAALSEARAQGAVTVDLTSRPSREAANRLYQRLGFVQRETNVYRFTL